MAPILRTSVDTTPHVTICVPAYNAERTLERTLDSILAQDYSDYDVLVCDNASTDNTAKVVEKYEASYLRYVLNPIHAQLGESNWNHVLSLAAGPLIALYHADDLYASTMVRRQVEFIQAHADVGAVFTMTKTIDDLDRPIRLGIYRLPLELRGQECFKFPRLLNAVLKYGNFLIVPTLMTKREALDAVGMFDIRFRSAADIDLWLRLSQWGAVGVIDEPLHRYRISDQQGTARINRMRADPGDFFQVMDHYLECPEARKIVKRDALKYYEMFHAIDNIYCAKNLLILGDRKKANALLNNAVSWRHFQTAYLHPRRLIWLIAGECLWIMSLLGAGKLAGHGLDKAYQLFQRWRRQSIDGG